MKRRTGFVSNSSSSSFLLLISKVDFEKVRNILHPYIIAVIDAMQNKTKVFGIESVSFETFDGEDYSSWEDFHINYDGDIPEGSHGDEMDPSDAFEVFKKVVKESGIEDYTHTVDM